MLIDMPIESVHTPEVHGVLIARHGKLVLEEYFHGEHRDRMHETRSAAKSLTATLIGAAMHARAPLQLSTPVYAAMNGGQPPADLDQQKRAMTLEHLLMMRSGYFCDDTNPDAPGNEDTMLDQSDEPDYYRYTLRLPLDREPGAKGVYCSIDPNLALGVLGRATGESRWPRTIVCSASRCSIGTYGWPINRAGQPYGGGGVWVLPRDFMKLGQVMLDGGTWHGKRILDADFAKRAGAPLHDLRGIQYGYLWWNIEYPYKNRKAARVLRRRQRRAARHGDPGARSRDRDIRRQLRRSREPDPAAGVRAPLHSAGDARSGRRSECTRANAGLQDALRPTAEPVGCVGYHAMNEVGNCGGRFDDRRNVHGQHDRDAAVFTVRAAIRLLRDHADADLRRLRHRQSRLAVLLRRRLRPARARRIVLGAMAAAAVSAGIYFFATSTPWLFARAHSAASRSGLQPARARPGLPSWMAQTDKTRATLVAVSQQLRGVALGPLISGLLAEYAPRPLQLPFLIYIGVVAITAVFIARSPETVNHDARSAARAGSASIAMPRSIRARFIAPAVTAFVVFSLYGFFFSLAPGVLIESLHESNRAVGGAVVFELGLVSAADHHVHAQAREPHVHADWL